MEKKKFDGFYKGLAAGALACLVGIAAAVAVLHNHFGLNLVKSAIGSERAEAAQDDESHDGTVVDQELVDYLQMLEAYVDRDFLFERVDEQEVKENIYRAFLDALGDPYTCYFTDDEYDQIMESSSGIYSGIGVMVQQNMEDYSITMLRIFDGSPAEDAGMLPGDILKAVNDIDVTEMALETVVSYIKGEPGTTVDLRVFRPSTNETLDLVSERRTIEVPTVEYEMLEDSIGYVELIEFDEVTPGQFKNAVESLKKQGMKGLVVDIRDNPGGILETVVDILDYLLPEGLLIYTEDKYGEGERFTSDAEHFFDLPLVVLMNEYSASASEIFAGAIRDYEAGTLVGTTTFGKGIVQHLYQIPGHGAMKITVSRYFTPSGECIHEKGVDPHVEVELDYDQMDLSDGIDREEDNQFQKAVSVMKQLLGVDDGTVPEEAQTKEAQSEEAQTGELQTEEAQTEETQTEEATSEEGQQEEVQTEEVQTEEAQTEDVQTEEASSAELQTEDPEV